MSSQIARTCHLCQSVRLREIPGIEDFEFGVPCSKPMLVCDDCGVIAMYPLPEAEEIKTFYPNYHVYEDQRPRFIRTLVSVFNYFQRRDFLKKVEIRSGRILEIGCATGIFLSSLKAAGEFECWGIDIGDEAIEICRRKGIKAFAGTLQTVSLPKGYFDAIVMSNLIEHVPDPQGLLNDCYALLRPGGKIYGETPSSRCANYYLFGRYWVGYHYPRHLFVFCQKNLIKMAAVARFSKARCYSVVHPGPWGVSVENLVNDLLPRPLPRNRGRTILGAPLMLAFLPLNIIEVLFRAAGMMRFVFEKSADATESKPAD